jgi:2-polyprenyl-3-methyl-5-hydroxy-6-metoxy-1,4-benzoquinol methylase
MHNIRADYAQIAQGELIVPDVEQGKNERYQTIQREQAFHDQRFADPSIRAGKVQKFYQITHNIYTHYQRLIYARRLQNTRFLEYGCGIKNATTELAKHGTFVLAIDISRVALQSARGLVDAEGASKLTFSQMNAEQLAVHDNSLDVICGTGILHHLDMEQALSQIAHSLRPDGTAIFIEPLGNNICINLYRRLTPAIRSQDEHPLLEADLALLQRYFRRVNLRFFYLTTLLAIPFAGWPGFAFLVNILDIVDRILFLVPALRKQAWQVLIEVSDPIKST